MISNIGTTEFASAERAGLEKLKTQNKFFSSNKPVIEITNSVSQMLVVLNQHRQIIYANQLFRNLLKLEKEENYLGKRPGEAVNCIHSKQTPGGCGTTEFCKTCGAVNAILESQKGEKSVKECRIAIENNEALDLQVTATPFNLDDEEFTIFVVNDISHEKRRQTLERVFFHDVLNSAGGISGLSSVMNEITDPDEVREIAEIIHQSADNLINEIQLQRQLSAAERGDLELNPEQIESRSVLKQVAALYAKHEITGNKKIVISNNSESFNVNTDSILLRRILGNMTKNAIEASMPEGIITLAANKKDKTNTFSVHNSNYIEREAQLQLFKRSFSTKGIGRGIGTYSMKLFGEKYLKGKVDLVSTQENGTTFYIELPD